MFQALKVAIVVGLMGVGGSASALEIYDAQIIGSGDAATLQMNVGFPGGCKTHQFELQLQGCYETFPVRCQARLVDLTTDDFCEAFVTQPVSFGLKELGLLDSYYQRGSLEITASVGQPALIRLP